MLNVCVAALALPAIAPTPAVAEPAQTYVVPVCSSDRGPHSLSGWTGDGVNECATGQGFGVAAGPDGSQWVYRAPDDVEISAARVWRTGSALGDARYWFYADEYGKSNFLDDVDQLNQGPLVGRSYDGLHAQGLYFGMFCGGGCDPGGAVRFSRIEMVLRDQANPRVVGMSGTAFAGSVTGTVSVEPTFADFGGGVRQVALLVDGAAYRRTAPKCAEPYTSAVPCPVDGTEPFELDTRALTNGPHTLSVELHDVAGNRSESKGYAVLVDNVASATAPVPRIALDRQTITSTYKATPVVRGTLRDAAGNPLAGVKVGVAIRSAVESAPFVLDTPVFSDTKGRVEIRLAAGGSREVRLSLGNQTAIASVRVKAPLRLKISPSKTRNGGSIRLHGSVPGTEAVTEVELQAQSGKKWIPLKTVALRRGRFSARYRFGRTFTTTRYRFRAVIHSDPRFPYSPATSPRASVLVRP
jgi:hypothetical protein